MTIWHYPGKEVERVLLSKLPHLYASFDASFVGCLYPGIRLKACGGHVELGTGKYVVNFQEPCKSMEWSPGAGEHQSCCTCSCVVWQTC